MEKNTVLFEQHSDVQDSHNAEKYFTLRAPCEAMFVSMETGASTCARDMKRATKTKSKLKMQLHHFCMSKVARQRAAQGLNLQDGVRIRTSQMRGCEPKRFQKLPCYF